MSLDREAISILEGAVNKRVKEVMLSTGNEKVVEIVKDQIEIDVYDAYKPVEYKRTYQLRDSFVFLKFTEGVDSITAHYGHDNKINSYMLPKDNPPAGRGYTWGKENHGSDFSDYIPWAMHEGKSGDFFVENGDWYKPKKYMVNSHENILREIYRLFK